MTLDAVVQEATDRAARMFPNDAEAQGEMVLRAWWMWRNRRRDYPVTVYAALAARDIRRGKPPLWSGRHGYHDATHGAERLPDDNTLYKPDDAAPLAILAHREDFARWVATLDTLEALVAEAFADNWNLRPIDVARALHISTRTVRRVRQGMRRRYYC